MYGPGPRPELLAPLEMQELYLQPNRGTRIQGKATYGRFRQFQVNVDEHLAPVKK